MKLFLTAGTTSQALRVFVQDTSKADGSGLTGLAYNTTGLKWSYVRDDQAAVTAVTPVTATAGTWTSAGFKELDATNFPGLYEVGVPNAALASGKSVQMMLWGAANMAVTLVEIELTAVNHQDATRFGLAALPNAAAGASGGLPTGDGSGRVTTAPASNTAIAQAVLTDTTDTLGADVLAIKAQTDKFAFTGSNVNTCVYGIDGFAATATAAVSFDNLDARVSTRSTYAGGAVSAVTAPVTVGTNNDKTGYALASTGLDAVSTAPPNGAAGTFREMMVMTYRRFFKKATMTASQIQTFADNGTTVLTTQAVSDDGTTQTQGVAS